MINEKYAKAYTEVLEIISHLSNEEYSKIPKEQIDFFKENMDKNYEYKINSEVDLSEQYISKEANAIIVALFRDYFATEKQKEILNEILLQNQTQLEEDKKKIYNPDDIFKKDTKKDITEETKQMQMIKYEESFFTKLKKFIFKILHIKES